MVSSFFLGLTISCGVMWKPGAGGPDGAGLIGLVAVDLNGRMVGLVWCGGVKKLSYSWPVLTLTVNGDCPLNCWSNAGCGWNDGETAWDGVGARWFSSGLAGSYLK